MLAKRLSPHDLFERISVRPPYFALEDLRWDGEELQARVPRQQPLGREVGPISGAEAGRHLAILGSCAAAAVNPRPGRHHYLAVRARFERRSLSSDPVGDGLLGRASAELEGRGARAMTEILTASGEEVLSLEIDYAVLPSAIFERRMQRHRQALPAVCDWNPYANELPLLSPVSTADSLSATLGEVGALHCAGHFEGIPALPVAILSSAMTRATGYLLGQVDGQVRPYAVKNADLAAENLAFAGERVDVDAHFVEETSAGPRLRACARGADGRRFATLDLVLQRFEAHSGSVRTESERALAI